MARRTQLTEVDEVLRTGPFDRALALAIQSRGLSLERIHARLRDRGVQVSLASLSYWQRGRCRPERTQSLRAVRALEEILGLPADSLVSLLGPRRPRGRWLNHVPGALPYEEIFPAHASLEGLLAEIGCPDDGRLSTLSHHETITLGPAGDERRTRSRLAVQARVDGIDSCAAIHYDPDGRLPEEWRAEGCRTGSMRTDPATGVAVLELRFDRPLAAGETYLLEYEFGHAAGGTRALDYCRGFRFPVREYLLQVRFHPSAVPARCYRTWQPTVEAPAADAGELRTSGWNAVHLVEFDVRPGIHGIRWEWAVAPEPAATVREVSRTARPSRTSARSLAR